LWETWRRVSDPSGDTPPLESCTIVTTAANAALEDLHDRMPVVLSPNDYARWLDPAIQEPAQLQYLLRACPNDELVAEPVSTHVNRVANDDPRCVAVQKSLFD
jgi:putative SOS response-associated peptidase YedK